MVNRSRRNDGVGRTPANLDDTQDIAFSKIPAEVWVPAQKTNNKRKLGLTTTQVVAGAFLLLVAAFLLVGAISAGLLFYSSDLIFPDVRVMGVNVGSMSRVEATAVLEQRWEQQSILLAHDETVWPAGVSDLGFNFDSQAAVQEAYQQGRTITGLRHLILDGTDISPKWSFDPQTAHGYLEGFADQVSVEPINAGLSINQRQVVETMPVEGRDLDIEATLRQLQENSTRVFEDNRLLLVTRPVMPDVFDTSQLAQEARRLLSTTAIIQAYDPILDKTLEWTVTPEQWGSWMTLAVSAEESKDFDWVVDEAAVHEFLANKQTELGDDRYLDEETFIPDLIQTISTQQPQVHARIYHHPRRHVVQAGETLSSIGRDYGIPYPWIQQANPASDFLRPGDELVIPSSDEMLPLPVVENKRIVVSISEQQAWVYEDGQTKWSWPASTGIDDSPTAPGIFQIQTHESNAYASNWDLWMPNFMGIYRPVPTSDFMNGFHGFPTRNGSTLLWTGDLGHKVTYGCVLLSSENAALLYDWAEDGVVVEVRP